MFPKDYYRRHLPHFQPQDAWYSATIRLAGSLPLNVVLQLQEEQAMLRHRLEGISNTSARASLLREAQEDHNRKFDRLLHANHSGPNWLGREDIATVVSSSLHAMDRRTFQLLAHTIMPNHVHVVFATGDAKLPIDQAEKKQELTIERFEFPVTKIFASIKKFTARRANALLDRRGAFWQEETYDHVIRDSEELIRAIRYVLMNPVEAKLVDDWRDWAWTYCKEELVQYVL